MNILKAIKAILEEDGHTVHCRQVFTEDILDIHHYSLSLNYGTITILDKRGYRHQQYQIIHRYDLSDPEIFHKITNVLKQ